MFYVYSKNMRTAVEYCIGKFTTSREAIDRISRSYALDKSFLKPKDDYYYCMVERKV